MNELEKLLIGLLKEAVKIVAAHPVFRNDHKDWLQRARDTLRREQNKRAET